MSIIRWGILSTAKIGREKVIPGIQGAANCKVIAIASRQKEAAEREAARLNVPKAYGSYEELLADPEVDAIYNPLPNHLHVEWSIKALQAGKHVLCEKPIGLSSAEAEKLLDAANQFPHLKVMEAFMYRFHPQWIKAKSLVTEGRIGELRTIHSHFSYFNIDPANIRNQSDKGGGGMMDIGCYNISLSRFIFGEEPSRVAGITEADPHTGVDRLASGIMQFSKGTSTFTCSTQLVPFQRVHIYGTAAVIEIEIPFNAPPDQPTKLWIHSKGSREEIVFDAADQYTLQANAFAKSIAENLSVPTPLQDAVSNMKAIEAIFSSAEKGVWKNV